MKFTMILFSLLSFSISVDNVKKCNEYFCYSFDQTKKGWELIDFAENFDFSFYGENHQEPLSLEPNFDDNEYGLVSINCNFPQKNKKMTLIIPNTVKYVKSSAFMKVTNVSIDLVFENDITIEKSAFQECSGLKSIQFNGKINKIGEHAFNGCGNLQNISTQIDAEIIEDYAFIYCTNLQSELQLGPNIKKNWQICFRILLQSFWKCYNSKHMRIRWRSLLSPMLEFKWLDNFFKQTARDQQLHFFLL